MILGTLIAQFGPGLQPPVENIYTDNASTEPLSTLEIIISNMIGLVTVVGALIFVFYFVSAALSMISAAGDAGKLTKSRDQMLHAVIGLVVLVSAYAVVGLVSAVVGLDILSPAALLEPLIPV